MNGLNNIDMSLRRRICLVKISRDTATNDNMTALHESVNAVINSNDINHIDSFLSRALSEHKNFYTVYNDSLRQALFEYKKELASMSRQKSVTLT